MKKRKMLVRMITASLLRRRSRMLVALLAIAIGATILSGLVTIYVDVPQQMGAQFRNYGANMIFMPAEESFTDADMQESLSVISSKELVGATPYQYNTVRIHEQPILAAGTDMAAVQKTSPYWLVEGQYPAKTHEILVGKNVAESLVLSVGESVTVSFTPEDKSKLDTTIDFEITGILNTGGSEEEYVYVSMEDMEELTALPAHVDIAEISVSAGSAQLQTYVDEINAGSTDISANLVKRVTASETTVLSKLQALVLLVTVIVLALTMICVATTMTAVVSERRSEIGLKKAIGASDSGIIAEFMGEGILLGGLGGILGSFVGFAFAQFVSINVFSSYISFRWPLLPITIIVSIAVTSVACLLPIRSATSVDPALVLKGE
ncbi:ABC transporter permease [uncultured Oscillibacter sp.]|uniref:ABC transporter permease n=1 Tax=uncultured Oscillibacter sp. TaxID=876091 RepID=UPI0025D869C9|nr:ABC transporter permease [uncultured Oscillibacter sp.]